MLQQQPARDLAAVHVMYEGDCQLCTVAEACVVWQHPSQMLVWVQIPQNGLVMNKMSCHLMQPCSPKLHAIAA